MKSKKKVTKKEGRKNYNSLTRTEKEKLLMYNSKKGELWKLPTLIAVTGIMLFVLGFSLICMSAYSIEEEYGEALVIDATISDVLYAMFSKMSEIFSGGVMVVLGILTIVISFVLYIKTTGNLQKKIVVTNEMLKAIDAYD